MNIGIPCDCIRNNFNLASFTYRNFLKTTDGYVTGLRIPEHLKKNEKFYNTILQEFSDWYYYGCEHYGHFIKLENYIRYDRIFTIMYLLGTRGDMPLLYKIFVDGILSSQSYETSFYIPYHKLNKLLKEIDYCRKRMEEIKVPAICRVDPFEVIFSYETLYSDSYRYAMLDGVMTFILGDKVMFDLYETFAMPESMFNNYKNTFAHQFPINYPGEKTLFTDHFLTFTLKDFPQWTRIVDIPTGRFIDLPKNMNLFLSDGEYTEFKIMPCPLQYKNFMNDRLILLEKIVHSAIELKKPIIGMYYQSHFISFDKYIDDEPY